MRGFLRKIRGWLGNAVVWGVVWSLATIPLTGLLYVLGHGELAIPLAIRIARTLFGMGFVAGGTFSIYLGLAYRNRSFDELRPGLFAVVGAIFGGVLVPVFSSVPSLVPGLALFLGATFYQALGASIGVGALLGSGTAYSTVKLAKAAALPPGKEVGEVPKAGEPARLAEPAGLAEGES